MDLSCMSQLADGFFVRDAMIALHCITFSSIPILGISIV